MSDSSYVPQRGDVVKLTFNPQMGHEQAGYRPALVLSPKEYNGKTNLAVVDRSSPLLVSFTSRRQRPPGSRLMPVTEGKYGAGIFGDRNEFCR